MRQNDHKSSANKTSDRVEHLKKFFDERCRRQVSTARNSTINLSDYQLHIQSYCEQTFHSLI